MAALSDSLASIRYFSGLSTDELNQIWCYFSKKTVKKKQIFLIEGDWSDYVYFIVTGLAKVYKTSANSKEQILYIAGAGESLNDVSALCDISNVASMLAMQTTSLYCIRRNDLKSILEKYPVIALNAVKVMAEKVQQSSSVIVDLSFKQVISRLATVLIKGERTSTKLRLTQEDLAAIVGTTREVITRSLKIITEKGIVRHGRGYIEIIDKKALLELATKS
jgi:CRP/FNR family transcriptional regulator, cyclic AMP receptor protein